VAFGLTFGVLSRDAGLGTVAAVVFSATTFAGSAQFAAASVLSAGGTLAAAIAAAVLLNARYLPIGLSVAPALRGPAWQRGLRAQSSSTSRGRSATSEAGATTRDCCSAPG
jgi:predicted branched-subunit amino acid permease